ncbi:chemotaxis protein CheW [Pseudomonas thivervalensis]|uniref:chemotaxis protein CheW n=1 Tax=Pseudomonas thivervalensis TaxID=86265 RepID=UPI003D9708E4
MGSLISGGGLSFWLLLAIVPGLVMLVGWLTHRRRIDTRPSAPVEPDAGFEPLGLDHLRQSIEQLNAIASVFRESVPGAKVGQPGDEATASPALPDAPPGATHDQNLARLAAKMHLLTELTAHMLEKRQDLARTEIDLALAADSPTRGHHYLSLTVDGELFAVNTLDVCAIVEASQLITKAPTTSTLRRAIRLRNRLVPVIDLSLYLAGRPIEMGWGTCVVILELTRDDHVQRIGVVVDRVDRVLEIPPIEIEPPVIGESKVRNDFILGTATVSQHRVSLLHVERGLSANGFALPSAMAQPTVQECLPT